MLERPCYRSGQAIVVHGFARVSQSLHADGKLSAIIHYLANCEFGTTTNGTRTKYKRFRDDSIIGNSKDFTLYRCLADAVY
jgi:hypothetical protein